MSYIPVRLSHLLRHSSVGAIVRGPDCLMTIMDTREWCQRGGQPSGRIIPYVEQVKSALSITQDLREPPIARIVDGNRAEGAWIPALRFPFWTSCPNCHLLHYLPPWKEIDDADKVPRCGRCDKRSELEQVPWVLIHEDGHMADLPWHYLAHRDSSKPTQNQCRDDKSQPYLKMVFGSGQDRILHCTRCMAKNGFDDRLPLSFGQTWRQPWFREPPEGDNRDEQGQIVEINDVRIHSSLTPTALVIPPESRIATGSVVDHLYSSSDKCAELESARPGLQRKQVVNKIRREFGCTEKDIEDALSEIDKGYPLYGKSITPGELLVKEYQALIKPIPDVREDEDFVPSHRTDEWRGLSGNIQSDSRAGKILDAIDNVVEVKRLKEIMVMKGFQRMGKEGRIVPPDIVGESDWLPALELYGEGVFFSIKASVMQQWETQDDIIKQANVFEKRYEASGQDFDPAITVDPRFLLLHTISHLLIREMETEAGYPAASLKERIYSSRSEKQPMAGVLVYVAVPDVAGSLGGLGELAEPGRLLKLLTRVFERAQWCSLDPVCSRHEGQGPNLLNRAACHACALIPETSCAYGNMLLDRTFIKSFEREGLKSPTDAAGVEK